MRAGLPDRRTDGGESPGRGRHAAGIPGSPRRYPVPLLRRRLPDPRARQGRQDTLRRRPQRPGQRTAPVREGAFRVRLHYSPAPPDEADDPPRRRAQGRRTGARPGEPVDPFPRGKLGGGAGYGCRRPEESAWREGPSGACGLRLCEGFERGSLSVPEAGPHRLRHEQRRSLHAALPRVVGGGADGGHRLRRRHRAVHRGG